MKIKFSKKLKWLGIGAGLAVLTTAAVAPVLVSCSNNDSNTNNDQNNGGGNNTPGQGNQGSGQGSNNDAGNIGVNGNTNIVTNAPVSTIDSEIPAQVLAKGAINSAYNLGTYANVYGVSAKSPKTATANTDWGFNTAATATATGAPAMAKGFTTSTNADRSGFAFNLIVSSDVKSIAIADLSLATSAIPTDCSKLLFGDGTTTSLLNNEWLSNYDTTTAGSPSIEVKAANELVNTEDPNQFNMNDNVAMPSSSTLTKALTNKEELVWDIKDPNQDQTLVKTGFIKIKLSLKNKTTAKVERIEIPVAINVIYQYKSQSSIPAFNFETEDHPAPSIATIAKADTLCISYDADGKPTDPNTFVASLADWGIDTKGSDLSKNVLNLYVDQQYQQVAFKNLTTANLIGTNASPASLINPEWLVEKGFIANKTAAPTDVVCQINTVSDFTGIQLNRPLAQYVGTTSNIIWDSNTNTSKTTRAVAAPEYSQYVSYNINIVVSKPGVASQSIPVELRIVAPSNPVQDSDTILTSIPDALKVSSDTKIDNAQFSNASLSNGTFGFSKADGTTPGVLTLNYTISSDKDNFVAMKQLTMNDLLASKIINENWLNQSGFTKNANVSWASSTGNASDPMVVTTQNGSSFKIITKTIDGNNYYVNDTSFGVGGGIIPWNEPDLATGMTMNFLTELTISEGTLNVTFNVSNNINVAPLDVLRENNSSTATLKNVYTSTTGFNNINKSYSLLSTGGFKTETAAGANWSADYGSIIKIEIAKGTQYFAFRLPTLYDLLGNASNKLLNDKIIEDYGLKYEVDSSNNVTKTNISKISWTISNDSDTSGAMGDLTLTTVRESSLGISPAPSTDADKNLVKGNYIANQLPFGPSTTAGTNGIESGTFDLKYSLTLTKDDGCVITLPITFRIVIPA